MEPTDEQKPKIAGEQVKTCKPYFVPGLKRLSSTDAKELILQNADVHDPEVQHMVECVDELQGEKGS